MPNRPSGEVALILPAQPSLSTEHTESIYAPFSNPFTLVPDVLGLIALQMNLPADFASFSLTCSAWYQATVDNTHLFASKLYHHTILKEERDLLRLLRFEKITGCKLWSPDVQVWRRHGNTLRQFAHAAGRCVINDTVERHWILLFSPPNGFRRISLYAPVIGLTAEIQMWVRDGVEVSSSRGSGHVEIVYPRALEEAKESQKVDRIETRFRTWTSVRDFEAYSCELLRFIPADTPLKLHDYIRPSHIMGDHLFDMWRACLRTDRLVQGRQSKLPGKVTHST